MLSWTSRSTVQWTLEGKAFLDAPRGHARGKSQNVREEGTESEDLIDLHPPRERPCSHSAGERARASARRLQRQKSLEKGLCGALFNKSCKATLMCVL